jgi:two-component system LytT family sensor kinase
MALSRLSLFPLSYMVVSKGLLALLGLACSLVLWRLYRAMLARGATLLQIIVVSVIASYAMALVWTAADNVGNIPIAKWLLGRNVQIRSLFGLFVGSVYNAFTLLAWSLLYFAIKHHDALTAERERSLRAEALAQRAQLDALRYQLHPHFLFNTLNIISSLVAEGDSAAASRMISRLSDFLRHTLATPPSDEVSLTEEVEFVRRYLEIEQARFEERLAVHIDVSADAWTARVPYLILQPLVENAVRHGIATREEGGALTVEARRVGAGLQLEVTNDGPGWEPGGNGERIGLTNTRERLARLYGAASSVTVSSAAGGTRVAIRIPFRNGEDASR